MVDSRQGCGFLASVAPCNNRVGACPLRSAPTRFFSFGVGQLSFSPSTEIFLEFLISFFFIGYRDPPPYFDKRGRGVRDWSDLNATLREGKPSQVNMPETNDKEKEEDMGYHNPKWPRHWTVERYKGEAPKDYAIIQWETAAFYTFDAEKDGKPLAFGFPGYYNQTTQMSVGITRLGSSRQRASITWESEYHSNFKCSYFIEILKQFLSLPTYKSL